MSACLNKVFICVSVIELIVIRIYLFNQKQTDNAGTFLYFTVWFAITEMIFAISYLFNN